MASEFIGLTVLITLKDPANTKLLGTIVNIINKDLVLASGKLPLPRIDIDLKLMGIPCSHFPKQWIPNSNVYCAGTYD